MRIQTRIMGLVTVLLSVVVAGIVSYLIWVQRLQVRADFSSRIGAMMSGVERIARESLRSGDEIMLFSYLKHLMREYPEIELALVSKRGHSSLLGEVRTALEYRTLRVTAATGDEPRDGLAASGPGTPAAAAGSGPGTSAAASAGSAASGPRASAAASPTGAASAPAAEPIDSASIPAGMLVIQLGLSKAALERQIREAQVPLVARILGIAAVGLLFGLAGSWWVSQRLARPIVSLAAGIAGIAEGGRPEAARATGDEIEYLQRQYVLMEGRILDFIRFKEDLLMTLTHEMNNPLTGLKGLLGLLRNAKTSSAQAELDETYKTMDGAVSAMELSLSNALHLFKMDANPELKIERVHLNPVLAQVHRLFKASASLNGIALEEPAIPAAVHVDADEELLRRVVINLVSNACKYTPPGGTVRIGAADLPDRVDISVSDTGAGIAPEDRELIFTKFYRAPGPDGKPHRVPGSGLGLAIAKQAVELHRGKIWVDSEKGKGSVFHASFPKGSSRDG